jgi:carboxyl-terminal processing protease
VRRLTIALGRLAAAAALLCAPAIASDVEAQDTTRAPVRRRTAYEDLQMFGQVLNQIRVNHPDSVDTHELLMAAIDGMVRAADPHSYVIPAMRLEAGKEQQLLEGKLHPVPVTFTFVGGAPVVVGVAAGTAASAQDILPGDELVSVDGRPVRAESPDELDIVLSGPKNSTVTLELERRRSDGSLVRLERKVRRQRFEDASAVPVAMMLDSATGYVRITTFSADRVADDLHAALERLEKEGLKRLLLDLRGNGGGRLDEAARVAGEFLPKGAIVYTAEGRKADVADTGRVGRSFWKSEKRYPMVVMVDDGTASASELVAGALQDHDRALIVGRPSFGKSLMMRGFPLSDGSIIVLVVGHVRTPCGRVVQRQYRSITRRDYYRLARAERDTAGRPSCRTASGRTVYGGGGIYPDVVFPEGEGAPLWLSRVGEQELTLGWVGGYVGANAASLGSLDGFARAAVLPAAALVDFRAFAERQGVSIPAGAEADGLLQRLLVRAVAYAKWGEAGIHRVEAVMDPEVRAAAATFGRAAEVLGRSGGR